jgi:CRP/FNR family cyclic AMP-dependent transcriptional regulator
VGTRGGLPAVRKEGDQALLHSGERQPDNEAQTRAASAVSLAEVWPDMLARVPVEDHQLAERILMMPLVAARDEELADVIATQIPGAFDFAIVEGVVLKETILARRSSLELLGPGDVLAPPLNVVRQVESRAVSRYLAHGQVSLAAINDRFRGAVRRWPRLADFLHDRLGRQTHRSSMHLAMLHEPRAEDRVIALFADLAERFGHVTADGILIALPLSHEIIGRLVGSRRPTVTIALQQLAADGVLERLEDNRWKLAPTIVSMPLES